MKPDNPRRETGILDYEEAEGIVEQFSITRGLRVRSYPGKGVSKGVNLTFITS